jgi:hypothetical protein
VTRHGGVKIIEMYETLAPQWGDSGINLWRVYDRWTDSSKYIYGVIIGLEWIVSWTAAHGLSFNYCSILS